MNWHDSGGAAFPIPHSNEPHAPCAEHGMSLRDWFAGKALVGDMAHSVESSLGNDTDENHFKDRAIMFYKIADAMLAAREVKL